MTYWKPPFRRIRDHTDGASAPQLVYRVALKRQAAVDLDGFAPHDLRRTLISDLLDGGVDLSTVSRQVGRLLLRTVSAAIVASDTEHRIH